MSSPYPDPAPLPSASPLRVLVGGLLMGFANLVPGVSGGTMILAVGLYDRFIGSVARFTSLRWDARTLVFLGVLGVGALVAIAGLSAPAVWLVTQHRWVAYSLFIGMTLGGVPMLLRVLAPVRATEVLFVALGIAIMAGVAFGLHDTSLPQTFTVLVAVGAVAASSMILPGISGSYILLIFGLYDVIVGSLRPSSVLEDPAGSARVVVPVAIGIALGIGAFSNVLKLLLARFERPSHAALLGLLLGSVLGLWPFQRAVHPELVPKHGVEAIELLVAGRTPAEVEQETGLVIDASTAAEYRARYDGLGRGDLKLLGLKLERYRPSALRIAIAIGLFGLGFALTLLLGRRGGSKDAAV
jgi:putative membrane protein